MEAFVPALIMAFREGLEAFLIIMLLLKFLDKTNKKSLKNNVWHGTIAGIALSLLLGAILLGISSLIGGTDATAKLWESIGSFIAVVLITTFIIWMINHGSSIKDEIEKKASLNLSKYGIFLLAMIMVLREGVEIAIFSFAGKYSALPVVLGIILSIALVILIYYSVVKISLKTLFNVTLAYLILQSGLLIGYSIHEGLSASAALGMIDGKSAIFAKAYDLSMTPLYHKEGIIGVPLYIAFGWYSKPEWVQFIVQYAYTLLLFGYWYFRKPGN
jgi:high-affinity iron transporter